jgi:hypothetical protein
LRFLWSIIYFGRFITSSFSSTLIDYLRSLFCIRVIIYEWLLISRSILLLITWIFYRSLICRFLILYPCLILLNLLE